MEAITPLLPTNSLGSSTSGAGGHQQSPQQFQEGQIVQAVVTAANGSGTCTLNIQDHQFLTRADSVSLSPGQTLQLQVTATRPTLELRIIPATLPHYLGKALPFIGQNLDLAPLIQALRQSSNPEIAALTTAGSKALEAFSTLQQPPLPGREGGEVLRRLLESVGLQMEARLGRGRPAEHGHSLKSALLEVMRQAGESEAIGEAGKALLGTIEGFQLGQLRLEAEKSLLLPLPFAFLDQGYLLINNQREQEAHPREGRERVLRFSLHLALTGLGNLRVDLFQTDEGLWMRFNCDSREKATFVAQFSDELREQLADLPLQGLSFAATATPPVPELIRMLMPTGQSLLNTKV